MIICGEKNWITADLPADAQGWVLPRSGLLEHLIARSKHGLMVQILSGLITYLLLAIHCHEQHDERVSIKRVRELRIKIQNETRKSGNTPPDFDKFDSQKSERQHASP
jgi:hypothetical protein